MLKETKMTTTTISGIQEEMNPGPYTRRTVCYLLVSAIAFVLLSLRYCCRCHWNLLENLLEILEFQRCSCYAFSKQYVGHFWDD
ncbi:hypothetical protein M430DRAFT_194797 [Amorphotheca resinae ATCC 22711]|jgi:hypothetical protein|uniref:Uncharacterized protein n=1 Tax=Amorphotheca resinae ATCC 22711 TaxID=857342 RepID=A0A2T3AP37_AMORE|nr:hypothetical protein M430DRAFT_194797 [Amorphotheca resinae ATCC 22711]PSS06690.1 hypothetical protein M430DRAFT_194797 [Amorphotheca resinae ATCC 22711]